MCFLGSKAPLGIKISNQQTQICRDVKYEFSKWVIERWWERLILISPLGFWSPLPLHQYIGSEPATMATLFISPLCKQWIDQREKLADAQKIDHLIYLTVENLLWLCLYFQVILRETVLCQWFISIEPQYKLPNCLWIGASFFFLRQLVIVNFPWGQLQLLSVP